MASSPLATARVGLITIAKHLTGAQARLQPTHCGFQRAKASSAARPRHATPWSGEDFLRLENLYKSGFSIDQIAKELGRGQSAVSVQISRHLQPAASRSTERLHKPPRRRWSDEEINRMISLYKDGLPSHRIAIALNRSAKSVYTAISRALRIGPAQKLWTVEEDLLLKKFKGSGLSWSSISEEMPERSLKALMIRWNGVVKANAPARSQEDRSSRSFWTEDEVQLLLRLKTNERLSYRDIMEYFPGRSYRSVAGKYQDLLGSQRPQHMSIGEEEEKMMWKLSEEGKSVREIAANFPKLSFAAVQSRLRWLSIYSRLRIKQDLKGNDLPSAT